MILTAKALRTYLAATAVVIAVLLPRTVVAERLNVRVQWPDTSVKGDAIEVLLMLKSESLPAGVLDELIRRKEAPPERWREVVSFEYPEAWKPVDGAPGGDLAVLFGTKGYYSEGRQASTTLFKVSETEKDATPETPREIVVRLEKGYRVTASVALPEGTGGISKLSVYSADSAFSRVQSEPIPKSGIVDFGAIPTGVTRFALVSDPGNSANPMLFEVVIPDFTESRSPEIKLNLDFSATSPAAKVLWDTPLPVTAKFLPRVSIKSVTGVDLRDSILTVTDLDGAKVWFGMLPKETVSYSVWQGVALPEGSYLVRGTANDIPFLDFDFELEIPQVEPLDVVVPVWMVEFHGARADGIALVEVMTGQYSSDLLAGGTDRDGNFIAHLPGPGEHRLKVYRKDPTQQAEILTIEATEPRTIIAE